MLGPSDAVPGSGHFAISRSLFPCLAASRARLDSSEDFVRGELLPALFSALWPGSHTLPCLAPRDRELTQGTTQPDYRSRPGDARGDTALCLVGFDHSEVRLRGARI